MIHSILKMLSISILNFLTISILSINQLNIQQIEAVKPSDITDIVFEPHTNDTLIAAFGDFNSDELTDIFVIINQGKSFDILLGSDVEPLLRHSVRNKCDFKQLEIKSIVPGDFNGDAYMDVMILTKSKQNDELLNVYINWGGSDYVNCTDETKEPIIEMYGEPLALDYNNDMVIDLFGMDVNKKRTFWIFPRVVSDRRNRQKQQSAQPQQQQPQPPSPAAATVKPIVIPMELPHKHKLTMELCTPHSNAYLDLNNDFLADLFLCTKDSDSDYAFEIWYGIENEGFQFHRKITLPIGSNDKHIGQSLFLDTELNGNINHILPICFDSECHNSTILIQRHNENQLHNLQINFKDMDNQMWNFIVPERANGPYMNAITVRGGDFNMDGYPDLLVTLVKQMAKSILPWKNHQIINQPQTFLLENVPCDQPRTCGPLTRTFQVQWKALAPFTNGTMMGAFYDFYQDGILDVIFVEKSDTYGYRPLAFRNTLDYDANFVKVIVLTGLPNNDSTKLTPFGRKKQTFGTNLPGPRIAYYTTTQEGDIQHGTSIQLPQSAYFSLHLPYTIFGLGRTPNFVDSLTVGLSNRSRTWTQLIPNSQMIVIPSPPDKPNKWIAQLFVTPSKLILMSVIALGGTCLIIMCIILGLYIKEKRQDKIEKLQEAHRFHFDAM